MISDRKKIDILASAAKQAAPAKTEANISNNVLNPDNVELGKA